MKFKILQEDLNKAITQASRFASTRNQLPILGNILLTASKTKLNVCSTNLEISVSVKVGAKIDEEGEISIPAKIISEIIGNLSKETVDIESEKEQLKISSGNFSSKILGMNTSDFPKIPNTLNIDKSLVVSKKKINESLSKIIFATGMDETRPVLTGALFILGKKALTFVSTDGFRLSRKTLNTDSDIEGKIVIPKTILNEVSRVVEESDDVLLNIEEKEKQVIFGIGDVILTSRLLEGNYPDYEKIIPVKSTVFARLDKDEFLRSVKLASVFARESSNIVKLKLWKDNIVISAENNASGSQKMSVDAKIEGLISDSFETAFNYRFLEDFLHSVSGEEVEMQFTSPEKAVIFKDASDPDFLHLIMPIKIQS